ncbi:MAG: hypothetical protein WCK36_02725 [Candidatus Firestonebacteria bacterium]
MRPFTPNIVKTGIILFFLVIFSGFIFAVENEEKNMTTNNAAAKIADVEDKGNNDGWDREKLKILREKDPKKFKEVMKKLEQILEKIKKDNPEKFDLLMQKRSERLNEMKNNNPRKYKELRDKLINELREMKRKAPEKYKELMEKRKKYLEEERAGLREKANEEKE